MQTPLVTISIPLFKCEEFLEKCLLSVLNQTYKNIEVTLINDQTPDNSVKIAEQFITEHQLQNWKIYHLEENSGLSIVRNKGIDTAQGKYLFFLDSDDVITPDCIEIMVNIAEKEQLEMVVGNTIMVNLSDGRERDFFRVNPNQNMITNNEEVFRAFVNGQYASSSWNKLVLLDFIRKNQLYFTRGLFAQDELQSFQTALVLSRLGFVNFDKTTLYYYLHSKSVIHNRNKRHFDNWATIVSYIYDSYKNEKNTERKRLIQKQLINYKTMTLQMNWKAQENDELWLYSYNLYQKTKDVNLSFFDYFNPSIPMDIKKKSFKLSLPSSLALKLFKKLYYR